MKSIAKIIVSSIIGTVFMTVYISHRAKKDREEYLQPVLLNKLIDNAKFLPSIKDKNNHPAGWVLHYGAGAGFVSAYWLLWKKALRKPSFLRMLVLGSISGIVGMSIWKIIFEEHHRPPNNDRLAYYKELFFAHMVFSIFSLQSFRLLDHTKPKALIEN